MRTTFIINRTMMGLYVTVYAGNHRLAKTSASSRDDLTNPIWNETFYVPVAYYKKGLTVSVKAKMLGGRFLIGRAVIPVSEVVRFDDTTQTQLRIAVHKVGMLHVCKRERSQSSIFPKPLTG
jgi:Ca2+-dependent lipid-binding protein